MRVALLDKRLTLLVAHIGVGDDGLEIALDCCHRGLKLVVDVVGELTLDAEFLLLLVQGVVVLSLHLA